MAASSQTNNEAENSALHNRNYLANNNRASGALIVASATTDLSMVSDL
jgi:hypothetical protein